MIKNTLIKNTFRRTFLAWLSVPALQLPSALGVQSYLAPTAGPVGSWSAAVGFEMVTSGVNLLVITSPSLRSHARRVTFFSVLASIVFNTLAHYQAAGRVPLGFLAPDPINWPALILSFIESLPLAALSCLVSLLLHQISQEQDHEAEPPRPAWRWPSLRVRERLANLRDRLRRPAPAPVPFPAQPAAPLYPCPHGCGGQLDTGALGRAHQHGRCPSCPPAPAGTPAGAQA